ncbi:hypothetical protein BKA70DRAFT_1412329 [Coprinopsis sp. MPI-PUGE-AT-0042]|nr:hypothetical protein BKA70DRAFT_1412329 [Coprinopsis sp. MPI-PUGE-AT-0042]
MYTISGYASSQISNFRSISVVEGELRFSDMSGHRRWIVEASFEVNETAAHSAS